MVGYLGSGNVSYGAALTAVFIEGWVFLLLSVTGARAKLITWVPRSIALAMSAGEALATHAAFCSFYFFPFGGGWCVSKGFAQTCCQSSGAF